MQKEVRLTKEGLENLEKELDFLKPLSVTKLQKKLKLPVLTATCQRTPSTTKLKTTRL